MVTDQVRIRSLYEGLYRTVILFGLLIAAAWLCAVFSYYLSRKTGSACFRGRARSWLWLERQSRSGSPTSTSARLRPRSTQCPNQYAACRNTNDYSGPQSLQFAQTQACVI